MMLQTITISAKRQITIPAKIFSKFGLKYGDKLVIHEDNGSISLAPAEKLVEDLAGSINLPKELERKSVDEIIEIARKKYFKGK